MKSMTQRVLHRAASQTGFGLVELMVSLVIGLVISLATLSLYSTTTIAMGRQDSDSKMADNATIALATLSRHIRNAGYVDWLGTPTSQEFLSTSISSESFYLRANTAVDILSTAASANFFGSANTAAVSIHGCSGTYTTRAALTNYDCTAAAGNHMLTVAYQVRAVTDALSVSVLADSFKNTFGQSGDCGNNDAGLLAINRFYLVNTESGVPSNTLLCIGNGNTTPVEIANNIEQLRFRYGQAQITPPTGLTTDTYTGDMMTSVYTAAILPANATATMPATQWPLVTSVEICVLVVGDAGSLPSTGDRPQYTDCDDVRQFYPTNDNRLRVAYKAVTTLGNRLRSTL